MMAAKKKSARKIAAVQGKAKPAPKTALPPAAVVEIRKICRQEFKHEFAREREGLLEDIAKRLANVMKVARRHCGQWIRQCLVVGMSAEIAREDEAARSAAAAVKSGIAAKAARRRTK